MGKIKELGRRVDGLYGSFQLAYIRIVQTEVCVKGHQVRHLGGRLAADEPGGKQGEEQGNRAHDYLDSAEGWAESISSQNFGFPANSSSSERGSWERNAKSLREFLWRTRWMTKPVVFCSK